jgi:hypothetical protein
MILWNKKIFIDNKLVNTIYDFINQERFFDKERNFYTSYFENVGLEEVTNYYVPIIDNVMKDLSLYHRSKYTWLYWVQMYNSTLGGHDIHDHFSGSTAVSWVHFIQVPDDQKCFHFLDSDGNKMYPKNQSNGDFIVFPPWALHKIDKVNSDNFNRIVVAGNITLDYIDCCGRVWESVDLNNSTLWNVRQ